MKKMTNQFLVTYAKQNQDLAILAIIGAVATAVAVAGVVLTLLKKKK